MIRAGFFIVRLIRFDAQAAAIGIHTVCQTPILTAAEYPELVGYCTRQRKTAGFIRAGHLANLQISRNALQSGSLINIQLAVHTKQNERPLLPILCRQHRLPAQLDTADMYPQSITRLLPFDKHRAGSRTDAVPI